MISDTRDPLEILVEEWRIIVSSTFSRIVHSRETLVVLALYLAALILGATYANEVLSHSSTTHLFIPSTGVLSRISGQYCGHLLGLASLLVYGLFRLGMGIPLASLCTVMIMTSPLQLYVLVSSPRRDYGRVLQSIALLWCLGSILKSGTTGHRLSLFSAGLGLCLGLGLRRNEAFIAFLIPSLVIVFIAPPFQGMVRRKFMSLAVLLLCFLATAPRPIVRYVPINTTAGIMTAFDGELGLTRPAYDLGYLFLDEYILSTFQLGSGEQGKSSVGNHFLEKVFSNTPADFLVRIYAATLHVFRFPFLYQLAPPGFHTSAIETVYSLRALVQCALGGVGIYLFLGALLGLLSKDFRQGMVFLFFTLYLITLLTTQFWGRNYIAMEFLPWWCFGFLVQRGVDVFLMGNALPRWPLIRAALIVAGGLGCAALSLFGLRRFQERQLHSLFSQYTGAKTIPLSVEWSQTRSPGMGLMSIAPSVSLEGPDFLMAEFDGSHGERSALWLVLRYKSKESSRLDWSRTVRVVFPTTGPSVIRYYFPAWPDFVGIELPLGERALLRGISRVERIEFPLLMNVSLPPTGGGGVLYQCLNAGVRRRRSSTRDDLTDTEFDRLMKAPGSVISPEDIASHAAMVTVRGNQWEVRGYAARPVDPENFPKADRSRSSLSSTWQEGVNVAEVDTDVLLTKKKHLHKGSYVAVEGEIYVGGLSLGLVVNGRTAGSVSLNQPGPFSVLLEVQEDGDYTFGVANHINGYTSLENRFVIQKATWVG